VSQVEVVDPALAVAAEPTGAIAPDPVIACARCGHAIAREEARVSRQGAHVHTRINPAGWVYRIGCFDPVEGCVLDGPATTEHTWFAGHAWRIALCGACAQHLGWRFEGEAGVFWGLILDRLR
jgi:hypothetical protein